MYLHQEKYIRELLNKARMVDCKPISTPFTTNAYLSLHDGQLLDDPMYYKSIIEALQYCTLTQLEISFALNNCQFLHAPTIMYLQAVKHILCYLKGTMTYDLTLNANLCFNLTYFIDVDRASCSDNQKTTGGVYIFFVSNLIS